MVLPWHRKWRLPYLVDVETSISCRYGKGSVTLPGAKLGYNYEVVLDQNGFPQIRPSNPAKNGNDKLIKFTNGTDEKRDLALLLNGSILVMMSDADGGTVVQFEYEPHFYVGAYNSVKQGSSVLSDSALEPKFVKFPSGDSTAKLKIEENKDVRNISDPVYS